MQSGPDLTRSLVHWLAQGKLDARVVLPALRKLSAESSPAPSLLELLETVAGEGGPEEKNVRLPPIIETLPPIIETHP